MKKQHGVMALAIVGAAWCIPGAVADEVALPALKDNTLYEDANGQLSNGMGDYFFAGNTQQEPPINTRRGLLAFDLSLIPAGSAITSAVLHLECSQVPFGSPAHAVSLHRARANWGEGNSDAFGNEGIGDGAQPGDATWLHTFYDTQFWTNQGGDFAATPSATTVVSIVGPYAWGPTAQMTADVQNWVDNPSQNFGWVLVGNESAIGSAKRFNSLQNPLVSQRPRLVVNFEAPATLVDVATQFGTYVAGNANSVRTSDNSYYIARSIPGFTADEANLIEVRVGFIAGFGGSTLRIVYEGRNDHPVATVRTRLRNWATNVFEQVDIFNIGTVDSTRILNGVSATNRIRVSDQRIELSMRKSVFATFSVMGFQGMWDLTRINVLP
jgi:hypothetical protein